MDQQILNAIRSEVLSCFESDEIKGFTSFDDFFEEVDVINAYEEEWEDSKDVYRPYFETVYSELR